MTINISAKTIAQEAIDFQKDGFGQKLEEFFKNAIAEIDSEKKIKRRYEDIKAYTVEAGKLSTLIYKRMGLNIGVTLLTEADTHMRTVMTTNGSILDMNHPPSYDSISAEKLIKHLVDNKSKNEVNIKTAKVTGVFTKLPFELHFPLDNLLRLRLTPAELTATCLHEIGHAFTSLEFLNRFNTANQVLSALTRSWEDDDKTREYVYATAGEIINGNRKTFESYEKIRDEQTITVVVIDAVKEDFVSQTGSLHADSVSSEQVADQFCARFGYARALITGLEKYYGEGSWQDKTSTGTRIYLGALSAIKTTWLGALGGASLALGGGAFIGGFLVFIGLMNAWMTAIVDLKDPTQPKTYDDLIVRHKRIKEQVIEFLKDKTLKPDVVKQSLEDLKAMDSVIAQYNTTPHKTFLTKALTFLSKKRKTAEDANKLQRELEELSANDLFVKSAELRTLIK